MSGTKTIRLRERCYKITYRISEKTKISQSNINTKVFAYGVCKYMGFYNLWNFNNKKLMVSLMKLFQYVGNLKNRKTNKHDFKRKKKSSTYTTKISDFCYDVIIQLGGKDEEKISKIATVVYYFGIVDYIVLNGLWGKDKELTNLLNDLLNHIKNFNENMFNIIKYYLDQYIEDLVSSKSIEDSSNYHEIDSSGEDVSSQSVWDSSICMLRNFSDDLIHNKGINMINNFKNLFLIAMINS